MKNIITYKKFITENVDFDYHYLIYFKKNGIQLSKGSNNKDELLRFAEKDGLREYEVFKNDPEFNSTTQYKFLMGWYDENGGSYWSNRAKSEPIVLRKKITK